MKRKTKRKAEKEYRPQRRTLEKIVDHLASMGLSVYGPNCDTDTGEELPGCMDYTADDIVKFRRLAETDGFWREGTG